MAGKEMRARCRRACGRRRARRTAALLGAAVGLHLLAADAAWGQTPISSGQVITIAGNGGAGSSGDNGPGLGFSGDGGPAVNAEFLMVNGVATDAAGRLSIGDILNNRIRHHRR